MYKIIGLDESGKIGESSFIFSQVEFSEESEPDLFIQNIVGSNDLFLDENITNGWDSTKRIRFCRKLLDNRLIKVKFYKLNLSELIKMYNDIFKLQANVLFQIRGSLIKKFNDPDISNFISDLIAQLYHYRNYHYLPEFFIKSYAFLNIVKKLCNRWDIKEFLHNEDNKIKVQIDGGYTFSFWWYHLLNSIKDKEIFEDKLFINGISHGDQYYLSMNLADFFATTFRKYKPKFFNHPIEDITYSFNTIDFSKDKFFDRIWYYLKNYYFKNRLLLIGETKLFNLIPYLLNFTERSVVYEPFKIQGDIREYFKYFNIGKKENNLVVHSRNLYQQDKDNINFCEDKGIEIKSIQDFENDFSDLEDYLNESIKHYDSEIQSTVKKTLERYKNLF